MGFLCISMVSAKKRTTSANAKRNGEGGEEHPLQETHQLRKRNELYKDTFGFLFSLGYNGCEYSVWLVIGHNKSSFSKNR